MFDSILDTAIKNSSFEKGCVKFIYFEKATIIWQNLPVDLSFDKLKTNQLENFVKFLWPSQNILTLMKIRMLLKN